MVRYTIPVFFSLLSAVLLCPQNATAQGVNLGVPPVMNFSRQVFRAGTQMWDITRSTDGVVWFANNDGLLAFDGAHWRLYRIDNGTIVRSVRTGTNGNIYVGGQGDFGFFAPDISGRLVYHSLTDKLENSNFTDVWDIEVINDAVFSVPMNRCLSGKTIGLSRSLPKVKRCCSWDSGITNCCYRMPLMHFSPSNRVYCRKSVQEMK